MSPLPAYLETLRSRGQIPRSQVSGQGAQRLRPLLDGQVLSIETVGRGDVVRVLNAECFEQWLVREFPGSDGQLAADPDHWRAQAIALRRDSKASGEGVSKSALLLRATHAETLTISIDGADLDVGTATRLHGVAACLITDDSVLTHIPPILLLIENLECFLNAERLIPNPSLVLGSNGRVSERLISTLERSLGVSNTLIHLPDYDPVGLADYLRLRQTLGDKVRLHLPSDLADRFRRYGNHSLISEKPRNRALLETLANQDWPCPASRTVYHLIKESGCGLEQEALLLL